jgi:cell division protein FtsB
VDSGAIERIAREKYLMKKPNEDIYVFEEDIEK